MNAYFPVLQQHASARPYELKALVDSHGILKLHLTVENGESVCLRFDSYVAYRKLDEGDAMTTLSEISKTAQLGLSFYRVEDSDFAAWYVAQSYGVRSIDSIKHYVVLTIDDVIDVLALDDPKIDSDCEDIP